MQSPSAETGSQTSEAAWATTKRPARYRGAEQQHNMRREPPQVHCSKPPKHTPASNFRAQPARQPRNPAMGQHQNSRTRLRCPDFRRIANLLGASKIRAPLSTWNEHPRTAGDTCRANSSTRIAGLGALPRLSEECQSTENQQNQHASVHLDRASKNSRRCMPSNSSTRIAGLGCTAQAF